jgi:hypothetical protein
MNKVEHIANEIVRGLKVQSGINLEPDDALNRGKKWLYGTGDLPDIPDMASQPLPDYLCAAIRDDASTLPSGRHGRPLPV